MVRGEVVAVSLLGSGLAASVVLCRQGERPVSTCIRESWPLRVGAAVIAAHVVFHIPHDPITWVGRRLTP